MIKKCQNIVQNSELSSLYPSRILAVQTIYSYYLIKRRKSIAQISSEYIQYHNLRYIKNNLDLSYYSILVNFTINNIIDIDTKIISRLTKQWKINRLPDLVLAILRVGVAEVINTQDSKFAIIINDYLQATKSLNHFDELSFINGVLDKIAKNDKGPI